MKIIEKLLEKEDCHRSFEIQKTRKDKQKLELRKSNLQNNFMDCTITPQDYQYIKGRVEKDLFLINDKLIDLQQEASPFKDYIQKEVPVLQNLLEYYLKSDDTKKKCSLSLPHSLCLLYPGTDKSCNL